MKMYYVGIIGLTIVVNLSGFSQKKEIIHLSGSFWDYETGTDLPTKITTYWKGVPVSELKNESKIEVTLSKSTDVILFESMNYQPLKLNLFFWGQFLKKSRSTISVKTDKTGKLVDSHNYIIFCKPTEFTSSNIYEFKHYNGSILHCSQDITKAMNSDNGLTLEVKEDFKNPKYQLSIKSENGKILLENDFTPQNGINFVDLNLYPNVTSSSDKIEQSSTTNKLIESKVYYFEQSKYDLLPDNKPRLDSLVSELMNVPTYTVNIKGFTDNVGDVKRNTLLAEYRSKVVANYLIMKGISKEKIEIDWENNIEMKEKNDADLDLKKFRKVEIKIKL